MNIQVKIIILMVFLGLASCGNKKDVTKNTYKVQPMALHKSLHFTGIVQPLKESTLTAPMDAVVETMNFHYGQLVKKGDVIFTLNSNELQKEYSGALTEYLKAKDNYSIAKAKFMGTKDLWEAGLVAKNNFLSEKSSVDTSRISLMESTRKLKELLKKMDETSIQDFSTLNLSDYEKIKKVFTSNHNLIHVKAGSDGVLLYPPKSEDKSTLVTVGATIKSGQVLALIGYLKGISIEIDVPEIDIDKIHPGMTALITGVAFGTHPLQGKLISVNAEASHAANSGLPSFTALIKVDTLTEEEQQKIKVGMSATIELPVDKDNQLLIPIAAVIREKGRNFVNIQLAQGGTQKRLITTGASQSDSVVIESGLNVGDVVLYD